MINFCDHLLPKTPPTAHTEPAVPLTHCKEMSTACGQDLKENSWHKIWVNMEMPKQFEYYNYYNIFLWLLLLTQSGNYRIMWITWQRKQRMKAWKSEKRNFLMFWYNNVYKSRALVVLEISSCDHRDTTWATTTDFTELLKELWIGYEYNVQIEQIMCWKQIQIQSKKKIKILSVSFTVHLD